MYWAYKSYLFFVNKVWPSFVKMLFWTSASLCTRAAIQFRNDVACVAWRFWLGALSNKGGRGQRNREEGAEATYFSRGFGARSRALRANFAATPLLRPARQNRHATQARNDAFCLN